MQGPKVGSVWVSCIWANVMKAFAVFSVHNTHFAPGFFTVCVLVNLVFTYVIITGSWHNVVMLYCNSVLKLRYTTCKCNNIP